MIRKVLIASGIALSAFGLYLFLRAPKSNNHKPTTNNELVQHLKKHAGLKSGLVEQALLLTDRGYYCRSFDQTKVDAYCDAAQPIPCNATISAPHMHVMCLQAVQDVFLDPTLTHVNVLDVGSGSGYISIVLAQMAHLSKKSCTVKGIEHMQELVDYAQQSKQLDANASKLQVQFVVGDGFAGLAEQAPFDIIHVGAAAKQVPSKLIEQLKPVTGRMVIPVQIADSPFQMLVAIRKNEQGQVQTQPMCKVRFVPLSTKEHQLNSSYSNETRPKLVKDSDTGEAKIVMPFLMNVEEKIDLKHQKWTTAEDL